MTRQEQAIQSRQKLIDTTISLIEEKGYSHVTIKDIVNRSGLSIGAFYHHFSNIQDVLFSYYKSYDAQMEEGINENHIVYWKDQVNYLCREYLKLSLRNGPKVGAAIISAQFLIEDKYLYRQDRYLYQKLTAAIESGKACHEIHCEESAREISLWLMRCVRGSVFDWIMNDGNIDLIEVGVHDYSHILDELTK